MAGRDLGRFAAAQVGDRHTSWPALAAGQGPIAQGFVGLADGLPPDRPAVYDRPHVSKRRIDLQTTRPPLPGLPDYGDQPVVLLDDPLRLAAKLVEVSSQPRSKRSKLSRP